MMWHECGLHAASHITVVITVSHRKVTVCSMANPTLINYIIDIGIVKQALCNGLTDMRCHSLNNHQVNVSDSSLH
jgi:hypothetical protein